MRTMEALRGKELVRHGQNTCTNVRPELGHTKRNLANLVARIPCEYNSLRPTNVILIRAMNLKNDCF